jgi:hypothetical protein
MSNIPQIDYEIDYDEACPKCGHTPIHWRECTQLGCEDGWISRYEEDPLWYDEDDLEMCDECWGTGIEKWCPACGADIQLITVKAGTEDEVEPDLEDLDVEDEFPDDETSEDV